jgi:hypothetical protein
MDSKVDSTSGNMDAGLGAGSRRHAIGTWSNVFVDDWVAGLLGG